MTLRDIRDQGVPLLVVVSLMIFIAGATWKTYATLEAIRTDVREIKQAQAQSWTLAQQERWAFTMERENRDMRLFVPDPHRFSPGRD